VELSEHPKGLGEYLMCPSGHALRSEFVSPYREQASLVLGGGVAVYRKEVSQTLAEGLIVRGLWGEVKQDKRLEDLSECGESAPNACSSRRLTLSSAIIPASMSLATPSQAAAWTSGAS
jgi:hypothetical protein